MVPDEVLTAVRKSLTELDVRNTSVLVAVSGGADSLALLVALQELSEEFSLQLEVAHFDHGLRAASHADARFVSEFCQMRKLNFHVRRCESIVAESHVEEQARNARYDFLAHCAEQLCCPFISVGHTANDQAETVLHHVVRGTGLRGLCGIPARRRLRDYCELIRPLLSLERSQLEEWLRHRNIDWLSDPTNASENFTRNRIRNTLLPLLQEQFNPQVVAALRRLAVQSLEAEAGLSWAANRIRHEHVQVQHAGERTVVSIACAEIRDTPRSILVAMFIELWTELGWPRKEMTTFHWQSLAGLVSHSGHPSGCTLPGKIEAHWRRGVLTITSG
ncbi:MAG: tRNA lysidine(34) synthetase TilS [Planctomycetaceae bacterium]|nr:tRNA lysidine(34) synthetase TilS [Planctomycetaceae bacterium]